MAGMTVQATAEQRQAGRVKAAAIRATNAAVLRSDFPSDDEAEWVRLAEVAGVRLPPYGVPCSVLWVRRILARLGISSAEYLLWDGGKTLGDFGKRNPRFPAKCLAGLLLEALDSGHIRRHIDTSDDRR
jgi:hypothetical protein